MNTIIEVTEGSKNVFWIDFYYRADNEGLSDIVGVQMIKNLGPSYYTRTFRRLRIPLHHITVCQHVHMTTENCFFSNSE